MTAEDNVASFPQQPSRPAPRLRPTALSAILAKAAPARRWIVPQMIPANTVTLFSGEGSAGKSLLMLQLAIAAATNRPWLDMVLTPCKPLVVSAEDDIDEIHRRAAAIVEGMGLGSDEREMLDTIDIVSLVGEDAVLATPTGASLKTTPLFVEIEAHIRETRPALIILDTLADLFGGDENQRTHARQFISLLRGWCSRYAATIVVLAHPSQSGRSNGSGESGSTGWSNSVRSRLYLERVKGEPDERELKVMKANYGKAGLTTRLRWSRGAFGKVQAPSGAVTSAAHQKGDEQFLRLMDAATKAGVSLSDKASANFAPAVLADGRGAAVKKSLTSAMNRLLASGVLAVEVTGPPSKRKRRLVAVSDEPSNPPSNAEIPTGSNH